LGNPEKPFSTSLLIYFRLFTLLQKKKIAAVRAGFTPSGASVQKKCGAPNI